jgi:hypothetical protein
MDRSRRRTCLLFWAVLLAAFPATAEQWFGPFARVADYKPKGPSHCFRQFNIDWSWVAPLPEQIPEFLSRADPVALAEFCRQTHIDGTIVMAVPHHGYCTYATRVGTKFPGMQGDWFGRTIDELHKRRIAAFGYVTLNWNWKYLRENAGRDFVAGRPDAAGVFASRGTICLNAPGYLELVEAYTREVLENYPVDGMRWDILATVEGCRCAGCKAFYRTRYGEELTRWDRTEPNRVHDFHLATTERAVMRLRGVCKRIKPSVEIWQNSLQSYTPNNLDVGRRMDIAYNEYGDPFRLLLIRGVTGKDAAINGLLNHAPAEPPAALDRDVWRLCLALGGRCYSYSGHKQTDPRTLQPGDAMRAWHRDQLAPFYRMASQIEPWLVDAFPVSGVGIVFSERTRFRYPKYDRKSYIDPMEALGNAYIRRSLPIEFVNRLDLGDSAKRLKRFKLLVLPLTSGLSLEEVDCLRRYVDQGGALLVAGDALRHDAAGRPAGDFALAREMGVSHAGEIAATVDLPIDGKSNAGGWPKSARIRTMVRTRPVAGQTLLGVSCNNGRWPLWHENAHGKGKIAYLASLDSVELTQHVIDRLSGRPPVRVDGPHDKQVVLTAQPRHKRWILHLIGDGDYAVDVSRDFAPAARAVDRFPAEAWNYRIETSPDGLRIHVRGPARDRLLVLQ